MDNDEWMAAQRAALSQVAGPGRLANLVTAMAEEPDFDFNLDDLFEFGLTRLLDGLDRHLAQVRKRRL